MLDKANKGHHDFVFPPEVKARSFKRGGSETQNIYQKKAKATSHFKLRRAKKRLLFCRVLPDKKAVFFLTKGLLFCREPQILLDLLILKRL